MDKCGCRNRVPFLAEEEAAKENYDTEKIRCLEHCIASHHGKQEWGAIVMPATVEAGALFVLDYLDSRIERYEEKTKGLEEGTFANEKDFMYGAHLYKPKET